MIGEWAGLDTGSVIAGLVGANLKVAQRRAQIGRAACPSTPPLKMNYSTFIP